MELDKKVRERITIKVEEETDKKVRTVFSLGELTDGSIIFGLVGNNGNMFAAAKLKTDGEIEVVV